MEKSLTNTTKTVEDINELLKTYNFKNFFLKNIYGTDTYTIIRPDGNNAINTLSEGEKSFISFLYFYFLIKGGVHKENINQEKIVVIDDPVSSMDFNTSFIISTLIKEIISQASNSKEKNHNKIKQVFLLSHNAYFFKEVTYQKHIKEKSFWSITKIDNTSYIRRHKNNPIKRSYDLLWDEIRNAKKYPHAHSIGIQNTCRRILEYYFKFIGNIDLKDLPKKFQFPEQIICNSFVTWAHDGSHNIADDIYANTNNDGIEIYLSVFEKIFIKMGHKQHYDMMMNPQYETP